MVKKNLWFLSNDICTDTRLLASCGKYTLKGFQWDLDVKKCRVGNVFVHRKQGLFLSVYVDDIKMSGKKQIMAPVWKKLMKSVDLEEPTTFLHHEKLGCTQRECKTDENIIEKYKKMFESRISAEATEKKLGEKKPHANTVAWSYDIEGHAQKCVER